MKAKAENPQLRLELDGLPSLADKVHLRWMIRRDLPEVLAIEAASFEFPWCEADFLNALKERNTIGGVAEIEERVVGFVVYSLEEKRIRVLNMAVTPVLRRQGIGRKVLTRLLAKLCTSVRKELLITVRETNLDGQLFLKRCGLRAVKILRGFYDQLDEDGYLFRYRLKA